MRLKKHLSQDGASSAASNDSSECLSAAEPLGYGGSLANLLGPLRSLFLHPSKPGSLWNLYKCSSYPSLFSLHLLHPTRENTVLLVQRLQRAKEDSLLKSYRNLKNSLKSLQDSYGTSRERWNVFRKYSEMKSMIKQVTALNEQLIDLPRQSLSENSQDYSYRVLTFCENEPRSAAKPSITKNLLHQTAEFAEKARDISVFEKLKGKSTEELRKDVQTLQNDIARIGKKFHGLKDLVTQLKEKYFDSKLYPIVPRYSMLKDMIKENLRAKAFVEVCHEIEE